MKINLTSYGALNIYIPFYGWLTQCYEMFWSAGKYCDGPCQYETVYPALQDMGMSGFRLNLWEEIIKERIDKTA